ncbi:hypothetical protein GpartN1_g1280.t1 [Galdieria partita]|uniref:Aconitase A/isopropylmalate dehydratase small subunit swivel domain-containing protein n=1 Tax=Galdieria partita TaxID=83374 RepID=A0A9C7UN43_9RHOD|nr:hypothetical protein GpartN1_g1280.t1 [Galdieria partita]
MKPKLGFSMTLAIPFRICTPQFISYKCKPLSVVPFQNIPGLKRRTFHKGSTSCSAKQMDQVSKVGKKRNGDLLRGKVFVVGDNIDTDQIIPAEYLTLVPSVPEEYEKLGSYALVGLPEKQYPIRFVEKDQLHTTYTIIVAGNNFGCGSSREHAPIALGAAGAVAVVAKSYARIFFRNCSATGELYPWESKEYLVNHFRTGEEAEIDFGRNVIRNLSSKKEFELEPLGDVLPVVDAGGLFEYARKSGMIPKQS